MLNGYNLKTITDAPCGDFFWMKEVLINNTGNIDSFTGIDIVDELIQINNKKYGSDKIKFMCSDLTRDIVPRTDLIICRDCFLHLSYRNIFNILNNFKKSGTDYLLASTYTKHKNHNVYKFSVQGRAINLEEAPFKIKNILETINEDYHGQNEEYNDKSLILIRLDGVNIKQIQWRVFLNEVFFVPWFLSLNLLKRVYAKIFR
jgi:hypothetical protein